MDKVESDCVLCAQEAEIIALGHCNHKTFCYQCAIKMRVISKLKSCPICKQDLNKIILTNNLNALFQDFDDTQLKQIIYSKDGKDFYTNSDEIKKKVETLNNFKCPIEQCEVSPFQNYNNLRIHLKDQHQRYFCDVCVEQKTCFLSEQQLYTEYQQRHHLYQGDYDEDGNLIFKHPFCRFCKKPFYDEEKFKQHLNIAHINCSLCEDRKFTFYKDHGSYEKHLKLSHYLCEEIECKQMLVVFKTSGELDLHRQQSHCNDPRVKKMAQVNVQQFAGFYEDPKQKKQLNDREGEDFSDQFVSLQKTNMRAIGNLDDHKDENVDFRDFLYNEYNDDLDKQSDASERIHQQLDLHLEDISFIKPQTIPNMKYDSFIRKCSQFLKNQKGKEDQLQKMIQMFENQKFPTENFVNDFIRMFDIKTGIRLLTFYMAMRDVKEQKAMWKELDDSLLKELKKLPKRNNSLILNVNTYQELFSQLLEQLNKHITIRIEEGELINFTETTMPKERIFQFIEVIRHVKTQELGKFKFALNFGLTSQVLELIKKRVLLDDISRIQSNLSKISNHDLVPFYLYVNLSAKILKGEQIHKEKKDVNECVYQELFQNNKKLFNMLKKPEGIEKEQILNKQTYKQQNGLDINQFDFPSLPKQEVKKEQQLPEQFAVKQSQKNHQQQQQQQQMQQIQPKKQQGRSTNWGNGGMALMQNSKAIEESFPSLDVYSKPKEVKSKIPNTGAFEMDESFKPLTDYVPQKSIEGTEWDNNPIIPRKNKQVKELGQVKKKNKTITYIAGGFR